MADRYGLIFFFGPTFNFFFVAEFAIIGRRVIYSTNSRCVHVSKVCKHNYSHKRIKLVNIMFNKMFI